METTQNKRGIVFFAYYEPLDTILGVLDPLEKISWEKGIFGCNETWQGVYVSIFLTQDQNIGPKMLLGPCSTQLKTVFDVLESNTIRLTTFKLIFMTLGG